VNICSLHHLVVLSGYSCLSIKVFFFDNFLSFEVELIVRILTFLANREECCPGWEDENQQMGMFPEKFIFFDLPPTIESIEENLYSLNMRRVNEIPSIFCHDGSYEMDHSFPDYFSSPTDTSVILNNHLRTPHIVNARYVWTLVSYLH
jgi:hypothetical protein